MAKFTVIDNNYKDSLSGLNILKSFIFGGDTNTDIEMYDPNRIYNTGDKAFTIESDGTITIVTAQKDGITGEYDPDEWYPASIGDIIGATLDNIVVISRTEPTEKSVRIWAMPIRYSDHNLPEAFMPEPVTAMNLIFTEDIPIVEDVSMLDISGLVEGDLIFDTEGSLLVVETDPTYTPDSTKIVDEQEDVHVGEEFNRVTDKRAFIWFDTDISDDMAKQQTL